MRQGVFQKLHHRVLVQITSSQNSKQSNSLSLASSAMDQHSCKVSSHVIKVFSPLVNILYIDAIVYGCTKIIEYPVYQLTSTLRYFHQQQETVCAVFYSVVSLVWSFIAHVFLTTLKWNEANQKENRNIPCSAPSTSVQGSTVTPRKMPQDKVPTPIHS